MGSGAAVATGGAPGVIGAGPVATMAIVRPSTPTVAQPGVVRPLIAAGAQLGVVRPGVPTVGQPANAAIGPSTVPAAPSAAPPGQSLASLASGAVVRVIGSLPPPPLRVAPRASGTGVLPQPRPPLRLPRGVALAARLTAPLRPAVSAPVIAPPTFVLRPPASRAHETTTATAVTTTSADPVTAVTTTSAAVTATLSATSAATAAAVVAGVGATIATAVTGLTGVTIAGPGPSGHGCAALAAVAQAPAATGLAGLGQDARAKPETLHLPPEVPVVDKEAASLHACADVNGSKTSAGAAAAAADAVPGAVTSTTRSGAESCNRSVVGATASPLIVKLRSTVVTAAAAQAMTVAALTAVTVRTAATTARAGNEGAAPATRTTPGVAVVARGRGTAAGISSSSAGVPIDSDVGPNRIRVPRGVKRPAPVTRHYLRSRSTKITIPATRRK